MVESASKGLILMYSKESLLRVFEKAGVSPGKRRGDMRERKREIKKERERGGERVLGGGTGEESGARCRAPPLLLFAQTGDDETKIILSSHSSLKLKVFSFERGRCFHSGCPIP